MPLIKRQTTKEGEIFNKWLESKLIKQNKNVLSAELGATGSGKSFRDLRKAELWYKHYFKEDFPTENICFGVANTFKKLNEKLRRGEVLIVEEAGVNLGSRNWQSNISKMFNHVLQSFRSMNVAIFFNLPYLSMLDSQARHLLHYYAESAGIDHKKGLNKCKPFFVQVAQGTGKIYRHYPKVKVDGRTVKVKRFNYSLPSPYLIDAYERKKAEYLKTLISGYTEKIIGKPKLEMPSDKEMYAWKLYNKEISQPKIAKMLNVSQPSVSLYIKKVQKFMKSNDINEKAYRGSSIFIKNQVS